MAPRSPASPPRRRAVSPGKHNRPSQPTPKGAPAASAVSAAKSWLFWWPDGVDGISKQGLFGIVPSWVDTSKKPGFTSQADLLSFRNTLNGVLTTRHFFMAPHSTWAFMALAMYIICPYEQAIAVAKDGWALRWVAQRLALNSAVALAYYSLFHVGLWRLGWGSRKFQPDVYPTVANMIHNTYYWSLGILQWTFWECVMIRLWATGKVPYTTNADLLGSWRLLALNGFAVLMTPCWRDTHFYIVHRFSHIRAVYKYVHSLHHRNTDPEPFSGLCMHPIEHLYYYSNVWTPCLYVTLSPFVFLYTFVHLTIAPGAGHSGFEDHFQSDQYHYLHHQKVISHLPINLLPFGLGSTPRLGACFPALSHSLLCPYLLLLLALFPDLSHVPTFELLMRQFECNYGSPFSAAIDMTCGTFREALGASNHYAGEWSEAAVAKAKIVESTPSPKKVWAKHSYLGLPASLTDAVYTLFWVGLVPLMYWAAVANHEGGVSAIISSGGRFGRAVGRLGKLGSVLRRRGAGAAAAGGGSAGSLSTGVEAGSSSGLVGASDDGGLDVSLVGGLPVETVVACVVAYGPILLAMLLARLSGDRLSWRWPFHKEKLFGTFGVFLALGWLCVLLPTYHAVKMITEAA